MQFIFFTGLVSTDPVTHDLYPPEDAKDGTPTSYCQFDVAVRRFPNNGEQKVDFFHIRVENKKNTSRNGEACQQYLVPGMKVAIKGELQAEQIETPEGALVMSLGVKATAVEFMVKKKDVQYLSPDVFDSFPDIADEDLIGW